MKPYLPSEFKLVVTSGPTREWIDPVRFISNPSSGKTGYELARLGLSRFREVVYIAGHTEHQYREIQGAKNIFVDTTESMAEAVFQELDNFTLLIMAAAPADYTPSLTLDTKIKKTGEEMILHLKPTIDILKTVGNEFLPRFEKLILVGFAAETHRIEEFAKEKLRKKNIHFICANQVYKNRLGFGENQNSIFIYDRWDQLHTIHKQPKDRVCYEILNYLNHRISEVYDRI